MKSLLLREIKSFFDSPIGYLVIAVFLIVNGLFLFVFEGQYNILNSGFADLTPFFTIAPWVLLFLIPAVTMRSFADERKQGTLELLLTKPLSRLQITLGKFLGSFLLILIALLPTLLYGFLLSDYVLGATAMDTGSITGSYFGMLFLIAAYTAIGIFCSSLTDNQIVSFILAVFTAFALYFGFEGLSIYAKGFEELIASLGMDSHFQSMARGVIDTRDVVYFLSITSIFVALTVFRIGTLQASRKARQESVKILAIVIGVLLVLNVAGLRLFGRFDLTQDQRYTLSDTSLEILEQVSQPLYVDVFLKGDFPGEFKRLQTETQQLLEEFRAYNPNVVFQFVDPLEDEEEAEKTMQQFLDRGLTPVSVTVDDRGKQSQATVFPWAIATYGDKHIKVPLLKNNMGESTQEKVISSVQHLEYAFSNAFNAITQEKQKAVAVVKGNGELHDLLIADFVRSVRDNYFIAPFTLDSVAANPQKTLTDLKKYHLAVIAKPTEGFSEEEKQVLDQFILSGGKTLWLVDAVRMDMDSLYNDSGAALAFPNQLNLDDMFFRYGFRIQSNLVKDIMATPIALASGEGSGASRFTQYPWFYSPWVTPVSKHPIAVNVDALKLEFAGGIELLKTPLKKTVLLESSPYSKLVGTPVEVSLSMVEDRPNPSEFKGGGGIPMGVLVEGSFVSMYQNRVLPFKDATFTAKGKETKMIVISDGDVIKNQFDKNFQPLELGFDKWTNKFYGNKEFLLNCVNYLLDENGLINIRSKEVTLALLDREKVYADYTQIGIILIAAPLLLLGIFGALFTWLRIKKYAR